jgi:protein-disulfide isomerase
LTEHLSVATQESGMNTAGAGADALIPVTSRDHVLGAAEPTVTLVEYGDYGCPFCFAAKRPVGSLVTRHESVRLVWRHFPNAGLHPGAELAAELSEIAAASERFWDAHELLLAGRDRFTRGDLESVAKALGLDWNETMCTLGKRRRRARVRLDVAGGMRAGVSTTPTFFLNGCRLEGHWRNLAKVVPQLLAEPEKRPRPPD